MKQFGKVYMVENVHDYLSMMDNDFEIHIFHIYSSETNQKNPPIYQDDNQIGMVARWDNNAGEK